MRPCASARLVAAVVAARCLAKQQGLTHESIDDTVEREGNACNMQHHMVEGV